MILIFGKNGQVARALARQAGPEAIALSRTDADLMQPGAAQAAIAAHAPRVVINASAWTAVDDAEQHPDAADALNSRAPGEMARACAELDIPFLHISTDYVFDGSGEAAWSENDPPNPLNTYGRSKLAGEEAVRASGARHVILRTSWVFSEDGANFVKTMLRLSQTHTQLRVVADQIGGPTPATDIAAALLRCARVLEAPQNKHEMIGGTYHFSGAPDTSWAGFARETFRQAGRETQVQDIPTRDYPTPAPRPLNSRLNCTKLLADFGINQPSWQAGLARVLRELDI